MPNIHHHRTLSNSATPATKRHWHELDSMRGLAALTVFLSHTLGTDPTIEKYTSFPRALWDGASAVDLFFVLSGFVLYASSNFHDLKNFWSNYSAFLIKRIFRLYPLLWMSLLVALLCQSVSMPLAQMNELSEWAQSQWSRPPGLLDWLANSLLIFPGLDTHAINPVIWSLAVEMKMSLVLPFIFLLMNRLPISVTFLFLCVLVMAILNGQAVHLGLMVWCPPFMAGALLARYQHKIFLRLGSFSTCSWAILFMFGIFLYGNRYTFPHQVQGVLSDLLSSAGAAILIICATCQPRLSHWLHAAWLRYSGRISYGLYLLHMPVLFVIVTSWPALPLPLLGAITLGITVLVAHHLNRSIEQPCIVSGREVSTRLFSLAPSRLH